MTSTTSSDERIADSVDRMSTEPTPHKWISAMIPIVYLLVGIAAYWRALGGISRNPFISGWDYEQSVWFLAWIPHALAHGLNPFFSNAILAPTGVNLAQNTASPLLGLATVPLSPFLDPMARANLLVVLAMPLSATSAFIVFRKWNVVRSAAALGGFIFGFSSYMVDQNVEVIFLPLVPLIALVIVSILRNAEAWPRLGLAFGLLVTAQYLISPEILTIVLLFAVAGTAFVAVRDRTTIVKGFWRSVVLAAAVSATLLAYPIWMMFIGPQHFTGRTWPTINLFHNDLLSLVVPGSEQKVSLGFRTIGNHITTVSTSGAGGYIGVPLIAIAFYCAWKSRKHLRTQVVALLMLGGIVLSLGPYLVVDGRQTDFPLPFLALDHLPLLDNILPSRVSLITDVCIAAVIAFGLDDRLRISSSESSPLSHRTYAGNIALVAGSVIGVLLATPPPQEVVPNLVTAPAAETLPAVVRQAVPNGDPTAITFPFASSLAMEPMEWQFDDGFRFRLLGGYAYHPSPNGGAVLTPAVMQPRGLEQFLAGHYLLTAYSLSPLYGKPMELGPDLVATTRATLSDYDVRLVIVNTARLGAGPVITLFRETLGPPSVTYGSFTAWVSKHGAL
jgi:hypothetical protein